MTEETGRVGEGVAVSVVVDCGGTSSRIALIVDGEERARIDGEASLSGYLEPSRIGTVLRKLLEPVEERYRGLGLVGSDVAVVIAAAGFVDSLRAEYRAAAESVVADAFGGAVSTLTFVNDAVALFLGHDADGVIVAGTGSNVLMRTAAGGVVQRGGHDWVAADEGAGFWIGLDGIRRVKRDADDDQCSALVDAFCRTYDVDAAGIIGRFRELAVAGPQMKAQIARFAVGVCDAAAAGDDAALGIVDRQIAELVGTVERAIGAATRPGRVVLSGGMMRNALYGDTFRRRMAAAVGEIDWLLVDDGMGAVAAMAAHGPGWPAALGGFRPLVVGA
ncbi:BadF/BadG/BcrA/BcrD ATPase family protein [Gordonia phthalatica]|uniref:ATPase BadF/BadG/BcrA/BcrD type domain-containing protein n=1 Tax=Gordonia phthalatica TaxID=1136941 RepID=A0A0N9NFF1_9ACTN|nr:BadF/BadG/BcrA/BcrD ATPase family protein [Gordonia phthalatica]ALG86413.1 hypothetical protein ACH46_20340 [Gordonia phthalatica]